VAGTFFRGLNIMNKIEIEKASSIRIEDGSGDSVRMVINNEVDGSVYVKISSRIDGTERSLLINHNFIKYLSEFIGRNID